MIDWDNEPLLGRMRDSPLGRLLGVSRQAVGHARKVRGMPSAAAPRVDWDLQPLGRCLDGDLDRKLGVPRGSAWQARRRRGIPLFVETESKRSALKRRPLKLLKLTPEELSRVELLERYGR